MPPRRTGTYLHFPRSVVRHGVLRGHQVVAVETGGIEGDRLHHGDAALGVRPTHARALVFVQPVFKEVLEQGALGPLRQNLDLWRGRASRPSEARGLPWPNVARATAYLTLVRVVLVRDELVGQGQRGFALFRVGVATCARAS